jgi:hypothetical protein
MGVILCYSNITQAYGQIKRNKVVAGLTIFTMHGSARERGSNPPTYSIYKIPVHNKLQISKNFIVKINNFITLKPLKSCVL